MSVNQQINLTPAQVRQLDAAITQSMTHGDRVTIPLYEGERLVLTVDGINGTIQGWLSHPDEEAEE